MVNKRGLFAFCLIRLFVVQEGTTSHHSGTEVVLIVDGKGCKEGERAVATLPPQGLLLRTSREQFCSKSKRPYVKRPGSWRVKPIVNPGLFQPLAAVQ